MQMAADLPNLIVATGALGTAAFGLVDTSKFFNGGISNMGFNKILERLVPFDKVLGLAEPDTSPAYQTMRANWLNGMPKADQKATAKSLIRLALKPGDVKGLELQNVPAGEVESAIAKAQAGTALEQPEIDALGRLDAAIDARLDAGYERGEQVYRNTAKFAAAVVAIVLALLASTQVSIEGVQGAPENMLYALLIGILAVPLAPVAKDLASALGTAVSALKAAKG